MKQIPLSQGKFAVVDDEDFPALNQHKWSAHIEGRSTYAIATVNGKQIRMHCVLLNLKRVDHADGNGLNNQRYNLRPANLSQNAANAAKMNHKSGKTTSSQYKGVSKVKYSTRWQGTLRKDGKRIHLGYFSTELETAQAYDVAAVQHFGEFARLNFPVDKTPAVV